MTHRALLSVYDKSGLADFARALDRLGWELVASGGTASHLLAQGLPVTDVGLLTGMPEMLGGRVKTLHPAIHGAILARNTTADQEELGQYGIEMIDLVVCNLYPFEKTIARSDVTPAEAIEQIDIGGVTLLRAAAKNFARVVVICQPGDYGSLLTALKTGEVDALTRQWLALKAFQYTRDYDAAIAAYLKALAQAN